MLPSLPLLFALSLHSYALHTAAFLKPPSCQRISVRLCEDAPYNYTRMPNRFGHEDQDKVSSDIQHYEPLVKIECSKHVKFFICALFTPMCTDTVDETVTACRSVCEGVKQDCQSTLLNFGFSWPPSLNCSQLPPDGTLCMHPDASQKSPAEPPQNSSPSATQPEPPPRPCKRDSFLDLNPQDPNSLCAPLCNKDILFPKQHKEFAEWWMGALAGMCVVVTGVTVITCLLDCERFRYPQRSIMFLAFSYHLYSWAYILRLILGSDRVSCLTAGTGERYSISGDLNNPFCVTVFLILYYFSLARSIWWVILTFTWYLAAKRKWSDEAIANWNSYYHCIAWALPAAMCVAVLITRRVDRHELTGLCMVGNTDYSTLIGFVIAPLVVLLLSGLSFLAVGYSSLRSVGSELRVRYQDTDLNKLERLKQRIAVFSFLFVLPSLALIGCHVYHVVLLVDWGPMGRTCQEDVEGCVGAGMAPQVEVYMLQIFMDLVVGITSGMWVFSKKTCVTWKRCLSCLQSPEKKQAAAMPLIVCAAPVHPPRRRESEGGRVGSGVSLRTESSGVKKSQPASSYYSRQPHYAAMTASSETSRPV